MASNKHTVENDVLAQALYEQQGRRNMRDGSASFRPAPWGELPEGSRAFWRGEADELRAECVRLARVTPPEEGNGESVEITVTRSAGKDGTVVIFIDTEDFEPGGSDGGPGLRVLINDFDAYVSKKFEVDPDGDRDAKAKKLTVRFDEIAYVTDETKEKS